MQGFYAILLVLVGLVIIEARMTDARATIQAEMCIEPDIEYPVPCDEDDDGGHVGGER
jgi:hypothetical protein